jgi:hypothetical protein
LITGDAYFQSDRGQPELVLQDFVDELESMIRRRPGAWHLWGDATLFFRQS